MRQQVSVVTAGFKSCPGWHAFHDVHKLVSRSLFDRVPLMLSQEDEDSALTLIGNEKPPDNPQSEKCTHFAQEQQPRQY